MAKQSVDKYANIATVRALESAAATQTTAKFAFPFSIMDKMGLIISRIEYWFKDFTSLNTTADIFYMGLTVTSTINDLASQNDPAIIDSVALSRIDYGTAASGNLMWSPFVKDFSQLPGNGLLVAPNPLYAIIQGVGTTPAASVWVKLFYTYMELSADEYWQLVESRRIIST